MLQTAAYALDLIVYLDKTPDGRRVVSEITQVLDYDAASTGRSSPTTGSCPGPSRRRGAQPGAPIPVDTLDLLLEHGYEPALHRDGSGW